MDLTILLTIIGQIATWVTIVLVYFTLREMRNQRRAAQKPELIIPNVSIYGYAADNEIFIASNWSNKELKNDGVVVEERPQVTIYNIGAGAAKEINIKWDFDLSGAIKSIQDYCYRNSIPVVVSTQNDGLIVEHKGNKSWMNIKAYSSIEHAYLMPAWVTSLGLKSGLPVTFLQLISILIFLDNHQRQKNPSDKSFFPLVEESRFKIPPLFCELSYEDISGERYAKKFDVTFQPYVIMGIPSKEVELSKTEPAFQGGLEFKEKI